MELSDYKQKMKELEEAHKLAKQNLAREYALANNPCKVGDIVTDGDTIIRIEKIITYLDYDKPECHYKGIVLKKDLKPTKVRKEYSILQRYVKQTLTLISDKK
jgi:hypothetical protein